MAPRTYLSEKDARYQALLDISKKVHPEKPYLVVQSEVNSVWKNELQEGSNPQLFTKKMDILRSKLATKKSGIMKFMTRVKPKEAEEVAKREEVAKDAEVDKEVEVLGEEEAGGVKVDEWKIDNRKQTKVQDDLKKRISVLEKKVLLMLEERSLNTMEGRALTLSTEKTPSEMDVAKWITHLIFNIYSLDFNKFN